MARGATGLDYFALKQVVGMHFVGKFLEWITYYTILQLVHKMKLTEWHHIHHTTPYQTTLQYGLVRINMI